ncbi:MAG: PAS domain S-box protein [Candidatus Methanoperedens sp.]|nr:PAS domain S-box protein [Candidatus Methanoperedens sp.]
MKILVVDDNKNDRLILFTILKSRSYDVLEAGNGIEALEQIEKEKPDIIVSDIMMPEMDGFMLLQNLKENRTTKAIPFVFYSATYTSEKDIEFGLSLGASRFFVKPMEPGKLLSGIEKVIKEFEYGEQKPAKPSLTPEETREKYSQRILHKLESKITDLEEEIRRRKIAEDELHKLKEELELKVKERTSQLEIEIEKHKKSEDALAESEQMYRAIFENTGTATLILEEDTTISMANSIFERLSGYSKEEVEGKKSWTEFVGKEDLETMKKYHQIRRTDPKKAPQQYEFSFVDKNGDVRFALISIVMIPGSNKSVASIIDITERKRAEQELWLAKEEAECANHVKSEFLSRMSHEFKTPLNAILGFSEMLKMKTPGELNEKQEHYVDNIHNSGKHLLGIINDMLDLLKIESDDKLPLLIEPLFAPELIGETMIFVQEKAERKGIVFKKEIDPGLGDIKADKLRFKQILLKLLDNTIKFSKPQGGTVTVKAVKAGDMAQFSISDTGIGIREKDMGKIFSLFHQVDSGIKRRYGGTGSGLAITKQLVEQHGGKLLVESKYGEGSTFTFTLPLVAKMEENK